MKGKHLLILIVLFVLNNTYYTQNTDSSAIILDSQDTIIKAGADKSLINPSNLELKQKNYWEAYAEKMKKPDENDPYQESLYKPMISLGVGTLSFYGDVGDTLNGENKMKRLPWSNPGFSYTIRLINPINDFLDVSFYAMFGLTRAVRNSESHLLPLGNDGFGFKSSIKSGGITFNYNFNQFLQKGHIVEPYIHLGIESIEYNSEIDINRTDNIPYDSDLSALTSDGEPLELPKNKMAIGIPLEIGAQLHVGNKIKFRVGTAMHFTSTDYIDGIKNSGDPSKLNDIRFGFQRDNLLFTHIAVVYDFNAEKKTPPIDPLMDEISMNLLLEDTIDSDGDGIIDHIDLCAKTLPNTQVDAFGCPVDDDLDGVPNSFDDELITYEGVVVNDKGVTMTDDDFLLAYKIYKDSTGEYSQWDTILNKSYAGPLRSKITQEDIKKAEKLKPKKDLFIVVGSDVQGVTAEDLWEKLADRDFQVKESGDSIMYVLGGYNEQEISNKIKELEENNVEVQGIVEIADNKNVTSLNKDKIDQIRNSPSQSAKQKNTNENMISDVNIPTFRVQIGAFNRKISKSVFKGIPNVVGIKGDDGLYRVFSGSFTNKSEAASHKVDLSLNGYKDAFMVAFQNGKRITLKEAGFKVNDNYKENMKMSSNISSTPINPEMVRFRVQVGAFKKKVPEAILANYKSLGSVMAITNAGQGYTKYYMGDFTEYKNVLKYRIKLVENGLSDCFIVGEFQKNIITSKEALNLLGQ